MGITEISLEYLPRVIEINMRNLPEHYSLMFYRDIIDKYKNLFLVWIDEKSNNIVAYIMNRVQRIYGYFHPKEFITAGHIISLAVEPEYRRRGIATALIHETFRRLKLYYNAKECLLEVRVSNTPAISLYKKIGFQVIRVIKGYYADGESAYLMCINLDKVSI